MLFDARILQVDHELCEVFFVSGPVILHRLFKVGVGDLDLVNLGFTHDLASHLSNGVGPQPLIVGVVQGHNPDALLQQLSE